MNEKVLNRVILAISIAVPVVVAILLLIPKQDHGWQWPAALPHIIGSVNTVTSVTLLLGLYFIKKGYEGRHRLMMVTSLILGTIFLVCYVISHLLNEPQRPTADGGVLRTLYLVILISHIVLSLAVLPLVLRAAGFAFLGDFIRHKRMAKFAYPVWLYVSMTGVIVYLMAYQM